MDMKKKVRLEAHGWKVGSAEEFLQLTPKESVDIDLRIKRSDVDGRPRKVRKDR